VWPMNKKKLDKDGSPHANMPHTHIPCADTHTPLRGREFSTGPNSGVLSS